MEKKVSRTVSDLGVAAYVKMHGFRCIGKKNKNWYFVMDEEEINQFEQLRIDYLDGPYHKFDSELMALKKLPEFVSLEYQ